MLSIWAYTIISVFIVSLISLIGVFAFSVKQDKLERILVYLVSLSAGTLLGDAFIHLIPEAFNESSEKFSIPFLILFGILAFFVLEKFIHWRHCHKLPCGKHPHPLSYIILAGDGIHNFIDGMIIAAGFLVSVPVGLATTIAVILHEIPQEIGDFGALIYGGFSRARALLFNFLSALFAVAGAIVVLLINFNVSRISEFLVPFAAGGFIYIASSDLIPEMHKQVAIKKSLGQLVAFVIGIALMASLLLLEQ